MDEPDFKLGRVGFCWGTIRRAELRRRSAPCVTSVFQWFQGATLAAHMFSVRDYCRWSAQAPRGSCGGLRQVQKMFKWHTGKSSGVRLPLLTHLFSLFQYTSGPQSCRLCRLGKGKGVLWISLHNMPSCDDGRLQSASAVQERQVDHLYYLESERTKWSEKEQYLIYSTFCACCHPPIQGLLLKCPVSTCTDF